MNDIERAAQQYIDILKQQHRDDDLLYIKEECDGDDVFSVINRDIRNQLGLWADHPLTQNWRENPDLRDIRNGVDYSVDHPDQVSDNICITVKKLLGK